MTNVVPITREPLHPLQRQLGVLEELTGIEIQPDRCAICSRMRGLGYHHLVFRSHGGHDGPLLPLCTTCHERIHDRIWEAWWDEEGVEVVEWNTGEVVWRQKRWPQELAHIARTAGDFIHLLDTTQEALKLMPLIAPALRTDEALEMDRALRDVQEDGWKARCRLLREMHDFRLAGLSSDEKIEALRDAFGLQRAQLLNLLAIGRTFADSTILDESPLSQGYFREAAKTTQPEAWVQMAQERKLASPQFSVQDLSAEIKRSNQAAIEAGAPPVLKNPAPSAPAVQRVFVKVMCPHGVEFTTWAEKVPVGSDGQPVDIREYTEEELDAMEEEDDD